MGKQWKHSGWLFGGSSKITADGDCSHEIKRRLLLGRKVITNLDSILKRRSINLLTKVHLVKAMVFPLVMYGCERWVWRSWALKNWCFWTVVLEKTLESPLNCKEIQPVRSEGDQPWDFFGRNDAKAEAPVLWPTYVDTWLIGKDSDAGRDWGQEEKGTTEDEMAGWHHGLDGREIEWTPGVGDGQGGLACCSSLGHKELDMTAWLSWTELNWTESFMSVSLALNFLSAHFRKLYYQPFLYLGWTPSDPPRVDLCAFVYISNWLCSSFGRDSLMHSLSPHYLA